MKKRREATLTVRLSGEELRYIKEAARSRGLSVSEYVRRYLLVLGRPIPLGTNTVTTTAPIGTVTYYNVA